MYSACAVLCGRGTEGHDSAQFSFKTPRATMTEDENFARFRNENVPAPIVFGTMPMKSVTSCQSGIFLCFARSEAYMTCILSHYARCFCIRVPGKDIDFVPIGAMFLLLGCTCNTNVFIGCLV